MSQLSLYLGRVKIINNKSMERETKIIETPIGKAKVEIKSWLTGGEKREITNGLLANTTFNSGNLKEFDLKGDMLSNMQDVSIKTVVLSVGGVKEDILKIILDMRSEDYEFILNECTAISSGADEKDVKKK